MRWAAAVAGVALLGLLILLTTPEPTPDEATPPTTPVSVASSTTTTTSQAFVDGQIKGALPDGTPYALHIEGDVSAAVEGIFGAVTIEINGFPRSIGVHNYYGSFTEEPVYQGGVYRPSRSGVSISLYGHIAEHLGQEAESVLNEGIRGKEINGFPTLELSPPFTWASDHESPLQVIYPQFSVGRGCAVRVAIACSWNGALQVVPSPEWPEGAQVSFVSLDGKRPEWDDNYLDPGPLAPRAFADVMWSGTEMIVWGGSQSEASPGVADGAAFDPITGVWRGLSSAPELHRNAATRAVVAGDQLIVVARDVTLGHDLGSDEWRVLGEGRPPPQEPGKMVWNGRYVVMWSDALHRLDLDTGVWDRLPDVPVAVGPEPWMRSLQTMDSGAVLAVGSTGPCDGRAVVVWTDPDWVQVEGLDLGTQLFADCSQPRQTAVIGERVLAWNPNSGRTLLWQHDTSIEWLDMARPPIHGSEGDAGGLIVGNRLMVPERGSAHIYDPVSDDWSTLLLPGIGTEWDMVWTGEEVLMWGVPLCCVENGARVDAWRWTPPD